MNIKKIRGKISNIVDLSKTAKEVSIDLLEPINFIPGSFVNVYMGIGSEVARRAYSISSSIENQNSISLTLRLSPSGLVTPLFWNKNMKNLDIELMGPLGLNTVDKMNHNKIYLFAFGVGCGVVKSIADYFSNVKKVENLTIITGSRTEDEILYKDYFSELSKKPNISVSHVVSRPNEGSSVLRGYIQDHIDSFDFNESDVYVCGQEEACNGLIQKIKSKQPTDCSFFVEAFH